MTAFVVRDTQWTKRKGSSENVEVMGLLLFLFLLQVQVAQETNTLWSLLHTDTDLVNSSPQFSNSSSQADL